MSSRIIIAVLMLFFVPQPGIKNQQDCRDIEAQLAAHKKQLGVCEQQLKQANNDCQAKLQEQKRELEAQYGQLKAELTSALGNFQKCQGGYNQLKVDLTKAQNDLEAEQRRVTETLEIGEGFFLVGNRFEREALQVGDPDRFAAFGIHRLRPDEGMHTCILD